jgi:hypothetical protein
MEADLASRLAQSGWNEQLSIAAQETARAMAPLNFDGLQAQVKDRAYGTVYMRITLVDGLCLTPAYDSTYRNSDGWSQARDSATGVELRAKLIGQGRKFTITNRHTNFILNPYHTLPSRLVVRRRTLIPVKLNHFTGLSASSRK